MSTVSHAFKKGLTGVLPWLLPIFILLLWEFSARFGWLSSRILPEPLAVLRAAWSLAASGELWTHVKVSAARAFIGFAIGGGLGLGFFIAGPFIREQPWFWIVDASIAAFVAIDLSARLFAFGTLRRWLKFPTTWVDLVVLATGYKRQEELVKNLFGESVERRVGRDHRPRVDRGGSVERRPCHGVRQARHRQPRGLRVA